MRHRSRLPAPSHTELGEDVGDVEAGRLLGDEQRLADLPVGPALGQQHKHLGLAARQAQGSHGGGRCGRLGGVRMVLQAQAAALGEQLDLLLQRRSPERNRRLVSWAKYGLGLLVVWPAGQECFGVSELA